VTSVPAVLKAAVERGFAKEEISSFLWMGGH
jgi:hypothetical protein